MLNDDGQLILDLSDIAHFYSDGLAKTKHSMVKFDTALNTIKSKMIGLKLYLDPTKLSLTAQMSGFEVEILNINSNDHYLAKLQLK